MGILYFLNTYMNRRSFVNKLGLLTGGLTLSIDAYPFLKRAGEISGKVLSGKKGIPNVSVTDGYTIVLTDKAGKYTIKTHKNAKFVYISTPSGFEFISEENIVRSYHHLGLRNEYNFNLKKLNQSDTKHRFIIWADPQVKNANDVAQMMATSVPDVRQYIESLAEGTLIHGIGVGDLAWDNLEFFNDYNKAVGRMGIPFFQALGNHDMDYNKGGDETSDHTFQDFFGPTYYSFNRGKAHYIILDDVRYLGKDRLYDGYIASHQLEWVKNDLKNVPKDHLLIICLHIPVHNAVKNNSDLYDLLKEYKNVHIMSGHTHNNTNIERNGIYEHNHGTVCGAWWTGPICEDGTPRGYGTYEVDGNELKWQYKPTGLSADHQISLSLDILTNQKRLIANVWNWDSAWKVEYFLDDKPMGLLTNSKGYDPLAVKLYKGKDLPAGRGFPEPKLNEHMFVAHCGPETKVVKVIASDRFGKKYEISSRFKDS